jgi:hypothetical protein
VDDDLTSSPAVSLAAVRYGMPVLDVRGAFLGTIEYVGSAEPGAALRSEEACPGDDPRRRIGLVRLQAGGRRDCDLFVASAHIAYVADDHVRLSITASEAITGDRATAGPG